MKVVNKHEAIAQAMSLHPEVIRRLKELRDRRGSGKVIVLAK